MKSISFTGVFVSTLLVSASAFPHFNNIFGRGAGDTCSTPYGQGSCGNAKNCKGIPVGGKGYCGGGRGGNYGTVCCVELVCKVPTGNGYCRSVKDGGCANGTFHDGDKKTSEWPCAGGDIQCCVPGPTPYTPDTDTDNNSSSSNGTSEHTGGDGIINQKAVDMLKELEGFRGEIYKDQVGVSTIGYGHNCESAPGTCEVLKQPISKKEAEDLMRKDLEQFEKCVCDLPNSEGLNSNQFSAIVSFAFNVGCFGLRDCFTKSMSDKDYKGICNALPKTNTIGGILDNRRAEEAKLCNTPTQQLSGCKKSR